jgi:sugar phosphate isomerase/epimerase
LKTKPKKVMDTKTRRNFLKVSALTTAAAFTSPIVSKGKNLPTTKPAMKLGLASYSFRKFSREEAIRMAHRAGLEYMCLKSMHLPLDSSVATLKEAQQNVENGGMKLISGGVIYMTSNAEVDQAFEYAKNAGMSMIIGVPEHELLEYTNEKIKEYDIRVAIHNHGPGDKRYPTPQSVYDKIKDLDDRFGICLDVGHTIRVGDDPVRAFKAYSGKVFDIHIKDVDKAQADGEEVEMGRGVINIPAFLKVLVEKNYQGILSFEYEKDADDPLPGLCECVGYVNGCLAMM